MSSVYSASQQVPLSSQQLNNHHHHQISDMNDGSGTINPADLNSRSMLISASPMFPPFTSRRDAQLDAPPLTLSRLDFEQCLRLTESV
jgi:hypothetical protein